jgi:glycine oxidase
VSPPSVIVIGAGVVGAACAWELASAGCRVRVLDARRPGQGATRASAGVLAPFIEGHPASALRDLGRESLALYESFIERLRADSHQDVLFERAGTLEVAFTPEEAEALAAASGMLWQAGVEARWVPAAVIEDEEPAVARHAVGALLIPAHALVGPTSLTLAAVAAAIARGATVHTEVGALDVSAIPGGGVSVRTPAASWEADAVVMAAGSWSPGIRVDGADPIPVRPIRGQLLELDAEPGLIRHIVWGKTGYLVPWPGGTVLAGATVEDVGFDEQPTEEGRTSLLAMAARLVPALEQARLSAVRVGLRPRGPDDLPVIGRSRAVPGLVYATAHYRNGVLLAPLTAQIIRDLVLGRPVTLIDALDPARCGNL